MIDLLLQPFNDYAFMQRALLACVLLSISGVPLGFFMQQRRIALVADAMSHAILPGVAIAFLLSGLALWPLTLGGLISGVLLALLASVLVRTTQLREDASFTLLFLFSLSSGLLLLSINQREIDLLHLLFGNILALNPETLQLIAAITLISLIGLMLTFRGLVLDCLDPDFLQSSRRGHLVRPVFFMLFVLNLVAAFQALGTLMAVGIMLLPAIAASFWSRTIFGNMALGFAMALFMSYSGLLISFYADLPSGAVIVFLGTVICFVSLTIGKYGSFKRYFSG